MHAQNIKVRGIKNKGTKEEKENNLGVSIAGTNAGTRIMCVSGFRLYISHRFVYTKIAHFS